MVMGWTRAGGDGMNWTKKLKGRCFHFGEGKHSALFLEDCESLEYNSIWLTDILIGDTICNVVINWQKLINTAEHAVNWHPLEAQMYIPRVKEWSGKRGYDDVTLM